MSYTVTLESIDNLISSWSDLQHLRWDYIFILPWWLNVWWREFGSGSELYLGVVKQDETIIGIAPLRLKEKKASFIGSSDVCDYLDFVVAPGKERDFFNILLDNLRQKGINSLELNCLRPDSSTFVNLTAPGQNRGYEVSCHPEDVSVGLDLPATWEEYLEMLDAKQRHEVKRKLKNISEVGDIDYQVVDDVRNISLAIDIFLKQFRDSRGDKATFMTVQMESFFRTMAKTMAEAGLLRFGILHFNGSAIAALMYFDYKDKVYLYNSSYDPRYNSLSAGLVSKVLCIKDSIERGKKSFDFMKGNEAYKYRLGGKEVPVYNCRVVLRRA
ncbi:MAG: GNAT family N-acetyltransferase [Dehalococcoidales bacterium]|nr:GNAT family N-acetyltransferase [Dehalococcoidales bacterium]